jgi:hypothetical protein
MNKQRTERKKAQTETRNKKTKNQRIKESKKERKKQINKMDVVTSLLTLTSAAHAGL